MNFSTFTTLFVRLRHRSLDPSRDWFVLVALSLITLAGIVVWNAWAFDTVANGGIIGTSATSTPALFNQDSLRTINAVFTGRAEEKVKYETGTYRFADPSQ